MKHDATQATTEAPGKKSLEQVDELDRDFKVVVEEVFGPKAKNFSADLLELLKDMWVRGVEHGVYVRQERLELPDEVVVPERNELNRAARKKEELEGEAAKIIDMAETLSVRLESALELKMIDRLEGDDLTKGVHRYKTGIARMEKRLVELLRLAEKFRILEK